MRRNRSTELEGGFEMPIDTHYPKYSCMWQILGMRGVNKEPFESNCGSFMLWRLHDLKVILSGATRSDMEAEAA